MTPSFHLKFPLIRYSPKKKTKTKKQSCIFKQRTFFATQILLLLDRGNQFLKVDFNIFFIEGAAV